MKGNFSKKMIASALAVMITASCPTAVLGYSAVSALELPPIPYELSQKEVHTFTFTNNTDYVEAYQNGKLLKSGDTVTDEYDILMTSLDAFTYTINGTMYACENQDMIMNSYKAECTPYGDFTVENNYKLVQHDDGYYGVSDSYIFLYPAYFNEQDMFYVDKSITGGVFDVQRNGRKVTFKTYMDMPVKVYYADSQKEISVTHKSGTCTNEITLSSSNYSGKLFIVRQYVQPGDFDVQMLPTIPDDGPFTVMHTSAMGKQEEIELGKGFATSDYLMEVDGAFSKSAVWGFWRDKSTGTGIVSVNPGTGFSVYDIFGDKVEVTKLGSSDDTRENYSFRAYCDMTYYLVKDNTVKTTHNYLKGDINSDGTVDIMDVVLLRQYLAGKAVTVNKAVCDVNGDGSVNTNDAATLTQYITGKISKLP
ncbi:dockerin type I repeat-containing protein [Ruminococcus albus]|uniref:Dockerin type I repeat-containing protein n=1 Tax=Ruminococcus albus TaxID=1264 RepID=A0A1H7FWD0_RUMAL|nr:dockerin type I repeat-containing protein [Ruminococcus albus]SEK27685.1 Dockerin type I repeat-containing protein [Ruminococcus albus]